MRVETKTVTTKENSKHRVFTTEREQQNRRSKSPNQETKEIIVRKYE